MSLTVRFKLYDEWRGKRLNEVQLARALERHFQDNLEMQVDLNEIARRVLLKFINDHLDKGVANEVAQGDTASASDQTPWESEGNPGNAVAESSTVDAEVATTPG